MGHLLNNGFFYLSGYMLARRKTMDFGVILRKLYRQAPLAAFCSYLLERYSFWFRQMRHSFALTNIYRMFGFWTICDPDKRLGPPWVRIMFF